MGEAFTVKLQIMQLLGNEKQGNFVWTRALMNYVLQLERDEGLFSSLVRQRALHHLSFDGSCCVVGPPVMAGRGDVN